jgi:UDP-N-acetylmuramate dehydrogenase
LKELAARDVGLVAWDASLGAHSYWRIGGPADLLIEPDSVDHVQNLVRGIAELDLPCVVIGDGSNLLFDDRGVRGVVVKIGRRLSRFTLNGTTVRAEAGVFVPRLVHALCRAGLTGLEHAIGIPGTLGGLILMNGGSMRKGVGANVDRVWTVDSQGEIVEHDSDHCRFSYRRSGFQGGGQIIVKARLKFDRGDPKQIRSEARAIARSRRRKFPLNHPNCGSVFLSDPALYEALGPPGKVIEDAGLKGTRIGDAMVSPKHANFIVNLGSGRSGDVLALIERVREVVHQRTGFWLRCEVGYVSPSGRLQSAHNHE